MSEEVKEYAKTVPEAARNGYLRACAGETSPRGAIKAFCLYCVGYVRQDITNCTAVTCPLYAFRPFVEKGPGSPEGSVFPTAIELEGVE